MYLVLRWEVGGGLCRGKNHREMKSQLTFLLDQGAVIPKTEKQNGNLETLGSRSQSISRFMAKLGHPRQPRVDPQALLCLPRPAAAIMGPYPYSIRRAQEETAIQLFP